MHIRFTSREILQSFLVSEHEIKVLSQRATVETTATYERLLLESLAITYRRTNDRHNSAPRRENGATLNTVITESALVEKMIPDAQSDA